MSKLARVLREHRHLVESELEANTLFLTCLAKFNLIEAKQTLKFEQIKDKQTRNKAVFAAVLEKCKVESTDQFQQFLDALRTTNQYELINSITDYKEEIEVLATEQGRIEKEVDENREFIERESDNLGLTIDNTFVVENEKQAQSPSNAKAIEAPSKKKEFLKQSSQTKLAVSKTSTPRPGSDKQKYHVNNKTLTRLQKAPSDLSSASAQSDRDEGDEVVVKPHNVQRRSVRRRRKSTFLTAPDSGSSTADLNASDLENEVRTRKFVRPRSKSHDHFRNNKEQDKMIISVQKAQATSNTTLRQLDRFKVVIRELKQDKDETMRRNEVLSARIENLNDHMTRISQEQARLALQPRRPTPMVVSPIPEETHEQMAHSKVEKLPPIPKNTAIVVTGGASNDPDTSLPMNQEEERCVSIMNDLLFDIRRRQSVLNKDVHLPPKGNKITRTRKPNNEVALSHVSRPGSVLSGKIEELTNELAIYMHQERQITHKYNLSRLQTSNTITHRSGDTVELQMKLVEKDLRKKKGGAWDDVNKLVENTKQERDTCYHMMCEIERDVKQRKRKLQPNVLQADIQAKKGFRQGGSSKQPLKTNLSKKMIKLQNEIKQYIDMEKSLADRFKEENEKKVKESTNAIKQKDRELKTLENKLETVEKERDAVRAKYKQARALHLSTPTPTSRAPSVESQLEDVIEEPAFGNPHVLSLRGSGPMLSPRAKGLFNLKSNIKRKQLSTMETSRSPSI